MKIEQQLDGGYKLIIVSCKKYGIEFYTCGLYAASILVADTTHMSEYGCYQWAANQLRKARGL